MHRKVEGVNAPHRVKSVVSVMSLIPSDKDEDSAPQSLFGKSPKLSVHPSADDETRRGHFDLLLVVRKHRTGKFVSNAKFIRAS